MDNHAAMPSAEMKSEGAPKDGEQSQATAATATPQILHIDNREALSTAFHSRHPVLMHLNADTTWLLSLPRRVEQARLGEQEEALVGPAAFSIINEGTNLDDRTISIRLIQRNHLRKNSPKIFPFSFTIWEPSFIALAKLTWPKDI